MAPRTQAQIAKLVDTTNQPLAAPAMVGAIPQYVTTAVPVTQTQGTSGAVASCIVGGNFPELFVGMRTAMRVFVLRERYADNGQIGLLGWMRADVQLAHAASFAKLIGIL
jgi:HK97 family phage major capsid protein